MVSSGVKIQSESLKQLLKKYISDNYNNSSFSQEIKVNLPRIITLAGLDIRDFKSQLEKDLSQDSANVEMRSPVKNVIAS